ncbi:MAG TPA: LysM peptidoglycan-binding domain-containing protein [Chitinophagaceae bacterium]|nr:LysM peptidoglycan-binding domain-containing protein [Chitinophagaceae bacterium]
MKKTILITALFLFAFSLVYSQSHELLVKSSDKGLYVDHKVVAKENFYSIGRLYNISAKEMAAFNKLDMEKGLNIGQTIHIPLTDANFIQSGNTGTPVYFKVSEKQSLGKVSNANNKVSIDNLRRWNGIKGDQAEEDSKLVIGFIMSKELPAVTLKGKTEPVEEKIKTEEKSVKTEPAVEKPIEKTPVTEPVIEKKIPVVVNQNPATGDQGYFKSSFELQSKSSSSSKNETVTAGIFKTASGWQDYKYYLLMDKVDPGTIVKITNPDNNKAVYAKVLGEMNGIRQNEGLNIRISNAAAVALNVSEIDKFIVKVNY